MKKYRLYKRIPSTIIGTIVEFKDGSGAFQIEMIRDNKVSFQGMLGAYSSGVLFDYYQFADGTPIGEEYEEQVELVHDEVYCIRYMDDHDWIARHFCRLGEDGMPLFYYAGFSSKTCKNSIPTSAEQVSEYDPDLVGYVGEPKNGYLYKKD